MGRAGGIETGPVVIYEILTVAVCLGLYLYYRRENRRIRNSSTMLTAECKSTLVDGSMSFGIGVVAVFLWFLPAGGPLDFLHYTGDFFITVALVLLTIKEPFGVLKDAFVERSAECMTTMRRTRSWSRRRSGICRRTPITSRYWCSRPA